MISGGGTRPLKVSTLSETFRMCPGIASHPEINSRSSQDRSSRLAGHQQQKGISGVWLASPIAISCKPRILLVSASSAGPISSREGSKG